MLEEMTKQVEEASRLEAVGQSLLLSPTRQLAQMATEARPSVLGGACPKETPSCHWRQGPTEGIMEGREGQKDQEVLAWHGCPLRDPAVPKEY